MSFFPGQQLIAYDSQGLVTICPRIRGEDRDNCVPMWSEQREDEGLRVGTTRSPGSHSFRRVPHPEDDQRRGPEADAAQTAHHDCQDNNCNRTALQGEHAPRSSHGGGVPGAAQLPQPGSPFDAATFPAVAQDIGLEDVTSEEDAKYSYSSYVTYVLLL